MQQITIYRNTDPANTVIFSWGKVDWVLFVSFALVFLPETCRRNTVYSWNVQTVEGRRGLQSASLLYSHIHSGILDDLLCDQTFWPSLSVCVLLLLWIWLINSFFLKSNTVVPHKLDLNMQLVKFMTRSWHTHQTEDVSSF